MHDGRDPTPVEGKGPQDDTQGQDTLVLSKYVRLDTGHILLRSSLPDSHKDSWPSQARSLRGVELPENWRDRLRTLPNND